MSENVVFSREDKPYANDHVDQCSNPRIYFHIYKKIIAYAIQWIKWLNKLSVFNIITTAETYNSDWETIVLSEHYRLWGV